MMLMSPILLRRRLSPEWMYVIPFAHQRINHSFLVPSARTSPMSLATFRLEGLVSRCCRCTMILIAYSSIVLDSVGCWPKAPASIISRGDARTKPTGTYSPLQADVTNIRSSCRYFDTEQYVLNHARTVDHREPSRTTREGRGDH
jgi:hypothetical protein